MKTKKPKAEPTTNKPEPAMQTLAERQEGGHKISYFELLYCRVNPEAEIESYEATQPSRDKLEQLMTKWQSLRSISFSKAPRLANAPGAADTLLLGLEEEMIGVISLIQHIKTAVNFAALKRLEHGLTLQLMVR